MDLELKRQMEQERKERNFGAYNKLIEANENLVDKMKWIKEDIEREIYKLENIYDDNITVEEIINDLKNILKNNS